MNGRSSEIESVAIVGGGFMGTGIAESVAVAGLPVVVRDVDEQPRWRAAAERIDASLGPRGARRQARRGPRREARERIELTTALEAIGAADLVIEAVPEDRAR